MDDFDVNNPEYLDIIRKIDVNNPSYAELVTVIFRQLLENTDAFDLSNPTYSEVVRKVDIDDPLHADIVNAVFQQILENIAVLNKVKVADTDVASTVKAGIVKLSSSISSTSAATAATSSAVRIAYNKAISVGVFYGEASGSEDVYSITCADITSLSPGIRIEVKINATNIGASSLSVNSLGVKDIVNADGAVISANTLVAGGIYGFVYNGTAWQLLSGGGGNPFIISALAPIGDANKMWIDTNTGVAHYWNGTAWVSIAGSWKEAE